MSSRSLRAALLLSLTAVFSCGKEPTAPNATEMERFAGAPASVLPEVRVSEFHYDNTGADAGERIEVSFPSGMDLTGWQILLYNGNGGAVYGTTNLLTGVVTSCGGTSTRSVVVVSYAVNGIQNGDPDGIVVTGPSGVSDYLSYGGSFTAVGGAANGLLLPDIGVKEATSTAVGASLKRDAGGVWSAPSAHSFGVCNDDGAPPPPAVVTTVTVAPPTSNILIGATQQLTATGRDASNNPVATTFGWESGQPSIATVSASGLVTGVAAGTATITATSANGVPGTASVTVAAAPPPGATNVRIVEIHYDNDGTDVDENVELIGLAGASLSGWKIVLYNQTGGAQYQTINLTQTFPTTCGTQGVVVVPVTGIQNGSADGIALVNSANVVVEFLSYEGTLTATDGPAIGMTSTDIGVDEDPAPAAGRSLQKAGNGTWFGPATSSFGACNPAEPPPTPKTIFFSGRLPTDPPLPVGFEDQLFAELRDDNGQELPSTFTWASETPTIASIDANGVMRGLAAGDAVFRATAADGTTRTWTLPVAVATASPAAVYGNHTEFGDPVDATPADDHILRRAQFTTSWNGARGTPNWVSFNFEATHIGAQDRCDCFTFDPLLPAAFPRYNTNDYTGAEPINGYRIDRGHLARSFDRTAGSLDNAHSFLFTNIIPQAADNNQGPWAALEDTLGGLAQSGTKELYIIAGVAGNKGTVKNEGKIVIPAQVWKVAVIMPRDRGLGDVVTHNDLEVIAVIMPNDAGIRNVKWDTYKTTVDAVEALSGYDLLSLLPDKVERAVESNTKPPVAAVSGPFSINEGGLISASGAGSVDFNGTITSYEWTFGDGGTASGANATHTYAQQGAYSVRLIVTDNDGLADTVTTTAAVANVAPSIGAFAGATILPGESYSAAGSFTDPGADTWTATVNYGDGTGTASLALAGKEFSLSHTYATAGSFTVTVSVNDGTVTTTRTQTVVVQTNAAAVGDAIALIDSFGLNNGNANALKSKLENALKSLEKGNTTPAVNQLEALLNQINAFEGSGTLTPAQASALRTLVQRIIESVSP